MRPERSTDPLHLSGYDDLPLWSAPFGLALLDRVRMRPGTVALDVGCGTGFPAIELAHRLGRGSRVIALDPWPEALRRARLKLEVWEIDRVELVEGCAEAIPLEPGSVDLVVSNNGLNNATDLGVALRECARVCRPGAQLVCTFNLPGTFSELYAALESVLASRGHPRAIERMRAHVFEKRKPVDFMKREVQGAGFSSVEIVERSWTYRFASAQAIFEHGFFKLAFVDAWYALVDDEHERALVFRDVQATLDETAAKLGEIALSVPFACFDCLR